MKTSTFGSSRLALAGFWLLVPGCGAFSGGQSGTDSLEVIGVNRPATQCESEGGDRDVGEVIERADGCETCVCQKDGQWECEPIDCEGGGEVPAGEPSDVPNEPAETAASAGTEPPEDDTEPAGGLTPDVDASSDSESGPTLGCITDIPEHPIGGSHGVYVAKDEQAEVCLVQSTPTQVCMAGHTVGSGEDYAYWGGGLGLVMSTESDGGFTPFDAESLGIESVRFTVSGIGVFRLRTYLNQVDDPAITNPQNNFVQNSFQLIELGENGVFEILLSTAALPDWTKLDVDHDGTADPAVSLDPSRLNSLQFFIVANIYTGFDFDVCISDVEWLDANGRVVVPE